MMTEPLADRAPRRVDEFFPQRGVDLELLAHVLSHPPLGPVLLGVAAVLAQARPAVRHRTVRAGGWLIDPAFGDSLEWFVSAGRAVDDLDQLLRRQNAVALGEEFRDLVPADTSVEHHADLIGPPHGREERMARAAK